MAEKDSVAKRLRHELREIRLSQEKKALLKQQMLDILQQSLPQDTWLSRLRGFWNTTYEIPVSVAACCLAAVLLVSGLSASLLDYNTGVPAASFVHVEQVETGGVTIIEVVPGR